MFCIIFTPMLPLLTVSCGAIQILGTLTDALALISHANNALAASIRQAAGWLGHASAQSAPPAKLQQVR